MVNNNLFDSLDAQPLIGMIMPAGFDFAPPGWLLCQGQLVPISEYDTLFAVIGTIYGGDGETTFALPDLRGRVPMGVGNTHALGQQAGNNQVTLTTSQMPSHSHTMIATTEVGTSDSPTNNYRANTGNIDKEYADTGTFVTMANNSIGVAGGSQPFDISQPYQAINFMIAVFGIFPSQG